MTWRARSKTAIQSYIDVWEINKTVPIGEYIVESDCGIFEMIHHLLRVSVTVVIRLKTPVLVFGAKV